MNVGRVCIREVIFIHASESLRAATQLMHDERVGSVVVCEEEWGRRVPVGMITDRDVAMAALLHDADLGKVLVSQAMSWDPLVIREDEDVADALERMRANAVRRAPVVGGDGALVGLISIDDLLDVLVEQLSSIVRLIARQRRPVEQIPVGRTPSA